MGNFAHTSERTARKAHRCHWCGERIERGERYVSMFIVCEGDAWRAKLHQECHEAEQAYDYDGDSYSLGGQFERGHSHVPG